MNKVVYFGARLAALALLVGALFGAAPAFAQETPSGNAPPCEPSLEHSQPAPFWETYGDYLESRLTVDEAVQNLGSCVPCALRIEAVDTDRGVSVETPFPLELGELAASEVASVRIRYYVPPGVNAFHYRLRAACAPVPAPSVPSLTFTLEPAAAYANEGCPPSPVALPPALPEPAGDQYGPRRFIATLRDAGGLPVSGHEVKWRISNPIDFSIMESSGMTDAEGNAYAVVSPPLFFICVSPYFDRGATLVEAVSPDSVPGRAVFFYTRCAPLGAEPPWTEPQPLP